MPVDHPDRLKAESLYIFREAVAQFDRPELQDSIGKASAVLLHPAPLPFPVLLANTTWKFSDMIAFRSEIAQRYCLKLLVHTNAQGLAEWRLADHARQRRAHRHH